MVVGLRNVSISDTGVDPQYPPGQNLGDKDVASITVTNRAARGTLEGNTYFDQVNGTVDKGYPYYKPGGEMEVANLGTIPVKVMDLDIDPSQGNLLDNINICYWKVTYPDGSTAAGTTQEELVFELQNGWNKFNPFDPGQKMKIYVDAYVGGDAEEIGNATVGATITNVQWNI